MRTDAIAFHLRFIFKTQTTGNTKIAAKTEPEYWRSFGFEYVCYPSCTNRKRLP
jgi:hypothetical protein